MPRLWGVLTDHGNLWMILEALTPAVRTSALSKDDLRSALRTLAQLHAQSWNSESSGRPFLPRVTECNLETLRQRLDFAIELLCRRQQSLRYMPKLITGELKAALGKVANDPEPILAPLRSLPTDPSPRRSQSNQLPYRLQQRRAACDRIGGLGASLPGAPQSSMSSLFSTINGFADSADPGGSTWGPS